METNTEACFSIISVFRVYSSRRTSVSAGVHHCVQRNVKTLLEVAAGEVLVWMYLNLKKYCGVFSVNQAHLINCGLSHERANRQRKNGVCKCT